MEKTVTEWQILFSMTSDKEDFYTEDENEYKEYFQELKDNNELDQVEQCIKKTYVWNDETEDWEEDWVDVLYDGVMNLEKPKYNIYVTSGEDGVYNTTLYDTVDSEEQASDMVAELQAQGLGAAYEKVEEVYNKIPKKLEEDETPSIVSYNLTNGGYGNNQDTVYGKLSDNTGYIYEPETDTVTIYDEVPIELLHILFYNSENEDELLDDEYQRLVQEYQDEHLIKSLYSGPLVQELHNRYFADDEVEEIYSDLDETNWAEEEASEADDRFENRYMNGGNGFTANKKVKTEARRNNKQLDYKLDGFKGVIISVVDKKNGINTEEYIKFDSMNFGIDEDEFEDSMVDDIKNVLINLYEFSDVYYDDVFMSDEITELARDITQNVLQLYDDLPEENIDREKGYAKLNESKSMSDNEVEEILDENFDKTPDIVAYNVTDGGYVNNADTVYGKLSDGTYFVYYTEMDLVETYDCEPDELLEILYADEDELPAEAREEAFNEFFEQHNVDTYGPGDELYEKLHKLYYEEDSLEEAKTDNSSKLNIEYVTPNYTGGGIYVYTGKLKDGNYFIADDTYFGKEGDTFSPFDIRVVDTDPNKVYTDEDGYEYTLLDDTYYQEQHFVEDIEEDNAKEFTKMILQWVIDNKPDGNYQIGEMQEYLDIVLDNNTVEENLNEANNKINLEPLSNDLYKELVNIAELYYEDLDNEEDDTFAGTDDSYANEMLEQRLGDLITGSKAFYLWVSEHYDTTTLELKRKAYLDAYNKFMQIIKSNNLADYKQDKVKNESVTANNYGKDKSDFKRMLKTFDNNGKYAKRGNWEIGRGGYDLWYEISYNKVPVIGCTAGKVSAYQNGYEEYAKLVAEEYGDTYIDTLTEGKVTTTSGTYDTDKYDEICNKVKQAYKDTWAGKISYSDLENIKKQSGLSSGELSSIQYMASRETDKKEETKKYDINDNTKFVSYEPEIEGTYTIQDMKDTYNNKVSDDYKKDGSSFEDWLDDMLKSGVYEIKEAKSTGIFEEEDVRSYLTDIAEVVTNAIRQTATTANIELPTTGTLMNNNSVILYELPIIRFTGDKIGLGEHIRAKLLEKLKSGKVQDIKCVPEHRPNNKEVYLLSIIGVDIVKTDETKSIDTLEQKVKSKIQKVLQRPDFGFTEKDINDYTVVEISQEDIGTKVQVRAELGYEAFEKLIDELNPVVQAYDKNSYFDMEEPGIASAILNTKNNKITEGLSVNETIQDLVSQINKWFENNKIDKVVLYEETPNYGIVSTNVLDKELYDKYGTTAYSTENEQVFNQDGFGYEVIKYLENYLKTLKTNRVTESLHLDRIQTIVDELKQEPMVKKYLYDTTWLSGSSTTVYPIEIGKQDITLQWKSDKNIFNSFIKKIVDKYPEISDGWFSKTDGEEPSSITFKLAENIEENNKVTEEVDKEAVQDNVEQEKQETGIKDDIDTEEEAKTATKKEVYQYAKQQGLDLEKLRKQGIELSEVAETLDKVIGNMVSKSIIEYEDKTGKSVVWDFEVKNNDIEIVISEI